VAEPIVAVASCYGASNTGQLAGAVATELVRENPGWTLVCLPAVAIDGEAGLGKLAKADFLVVIEGCPIMCCTKIIEEHSGRKADVRVEMVADCGVKKQPTPAYDEADKARIKAEVRQRVQEAMSRKEASKTI
jgi:uncharacterized metal-binding protein